MASPTIAFVRTNGDEFSGPGRFFVPMSGAVVYKHEDYSFARTASILCYYKIGERTGIRGGISRIYNSLSMQDFIFLNIKNILMLAFINYGVCIHIK